MERILNLLVDLGSKEQVTYINIGAIQDVRSWIWLPKKVEFLASKDGKIFKSIGTLKHSISDNSSESIIKQFELKLKTPIEAKYIKSKSRKLWKMP
jgi:hexosaminidase